MSLDHGRPVRLGRYSLRVAPRTAIVGAILLLALVPAWFVALLPGSDVMTVSEVLGTLAGRGDIGDEDVLYGLQMPRALTGIAVGMAMGVGGAIVQSVTRNPLGSPEIIGITTGASTGALLLITTGIAVPAWFGALCGAAGSALLVLTLARREGLSAFRLVLVGIGVNAILLAANTFLLSRADTYDAKSAANWLIGTLDGRDWDYVWPIGGAVAVLVPLALAFGRQLRMLELGDEHAAALGMRLNAARGGLLATGIALIGAAVAAAGPIAFVSLAAPHLTRLLCRAGNRPLLPSALMGALLVLVADALARNATPSLLPVGVVTGVLGGCYLVWLLSTQRSGIGR